MTLDEYIKTLQALKENGASGKETVYLKIEYEESNTGAFSETKYILRELNDAPYFIETSTFGNRLVNVHTFHFKGSNALMIEAVN